MKSFRTRHPIVRLPAEMQVCLFLICEELKSRRLFQALHEVGLDDCSFQPHLDTLILQHIGIAEITDECFSIYSSIMEKRSRKIQQDYDSIMKQALKAYYELRGLKRC